MREKIGELAVDLDSEAILPGLSYPSSPQEMERYAEIIYDSFATPSTRAIPGNIPDILLP